MIAWTIATQDMMEMAEEAKLRVRKFLGIETVRIIECANKKECHLRKIDTWLDLNEPAWFFDADWWPVPVRHELPEMGGIIIGAPNNTPSLDAYHGFPTDHLLCSGFWGMNPMLPTNRKVLLDAKEARSLPSLEDEKFTNHSIIQNGAVLALLSTRWNWCGESPPKDTVAIHAAGKQNKLEWLKKVSSYYEKTYLDK